MRADSLAFCLLGAANAVAQVRTGTALPQALAKVFTQSNASPQARGAIQDISYRTMRQLGRSETLVGLMTSKAPEPPMLAALLCCALSLMSAEPGEQPYEEFTVSTRPSRSPVRTRHGARKAGQRRLGAVSWRAKILAGSALQQRWRMELSQWWIDSLA